MAGWNASVKEKFSNLIADRMEKGGKTIWFNGRVRKTDPVSRSTGKPYSGSNRFILPIFQEGSGEFATFQKIKEEGGTVKKGEKGAPIVFAAPRIKDEKTGKLRSPTDAEKKDKKAKIFLFLQLYYVFEIGVQTEGIKEKYNVLPEGHVAPPRLEAAEDFVKKFAEKTNLKLEEANGTPCYKPKEHAVRVPAIVEYKSTERYYETMFHELVHSTMSAMKRQKGAMFGDNVYSQEEIVAETGSVMLSSYFGFVSDEESMSNQAEYAKSWAKKIRENPTWLYDGMKAAEKAVKYMLETAGLPLDNAEEVAG